MSDSYTSTEKCVNEIMRKDYNLRNIEVKVGDELLWMLLLTDFPENNRPKIMQAEFSATKILVEISKTTLIQEVKFFKSAAFIARQENNQKPKEQEEKCLLLLMQKISTDTLKTVYSGENNYLLMILTFKSKAPIIST